MDILEFNLIFLCVVGGLHWYTTKNANFIEYFYVLSVFVCVCLDFASYLSIDHNDISQKLFSFIYVETCFNEKNMSEWTFKIPPKIWKSHSLL